MGTLVFVPAPHGGAPLNETGNTGLAHFVEGRDYVTVHSPKRGNGGLPIIDYYATLTMGKELSMVENNDRGRMIRRYFIEVGLRSMVPFAPRSLASQDFHGDCWPTTPPRNRSSVRCAINS